MDDQDASRDRKVEGLLTKDSDGRGVAATGRPSPTAVPRSDFWGGPDLEEGTRVVLRRFGHAVPGEYRGFVRGTYASDASGSPDAYIVELVDRLPDDDGFSCRVFTRACVDLADALEADPSKDPGGIGTGEGDGRRVA